MEPILQIENLKTSFMTSNGEVQAVRGVSFSVEKGEIVGLVGESGSGKSVTSMSILKLLADTARIKEGTILFEGQDLTQCSRAQMRKIRGGKISMIFQDPMSSLNPLIPVGKQVAEMIREHHPEKSRAQIKQEVLSLFEQVRIPEPEKRFKSFPHEFSGGMRQRVMIAMALANRPELLIADEPTTALDVTIQAQLMDLLRSLKERFSMSVILVTHDLGVVADFADKVQVMYAGTIVERGTVDEIFDSPRHPYTWALLSSIPGRAQESKSKLYSLQGTPPDLLLPLQQCPFAPRCQYCMPICKKAIPKENFLTDTHGVACWLQHPMAPKVTPPAGIGGYDHE